MIKTLAQLPNPRLSESFSFYGGVPDSSVFVAPAPNVMQERVHLQSSHVRVRPEISGAIEIGAWRSSFFSAIQKIMEGRIFGFGCDLRVGREVPLTVKQRRRGDDTIVSCQPPQFFPPPRSHPAHTF